MNNRRKISPLLGSSALAILLAVSPASAQSLQDLQSQVDALQQQLNALKKQLDESKSETAKSSGDDIEVKWEPAPSISSADGRFEMNLRGRIYADSAWISDGDNNINTKATEFRAARLGIEGKAWKDIKYKFEVDFAGNQADIKDALIQWSAPFGAGLTLGHFKMPNSLDEQTSSRHIAFMERASFTDAFGFSRRLGLGINTGGDNWTAKFGVFRGSAGIEEEDEGTEFAGRVTYSPKMGDVQTHFGGSFRYRDGGDQSDFRYRQRPHQHLSPERFVDTGGIAGKDTFYGVELAASAGSVWGAAEYGFLKADANDPINGDPTFAGGYVEVGYFLTGESRGYKANKGAWDRPQVRNPVFEGGIGAWAVAARFDTIDLTEPGFEGGKQDSYILGVNWYINRHTRMIVNYSHASIKQAFDVALNGADGENDVDTFGIRAQVDW